MTTLDPTRPRELVLIGGPNGAGKTTIAKSYIATRFPFWPQVNADRLLERLLELGPLAPRPGSALTAAEMVDETVRSLCALGEPCIIETVLSSDKYKSLVDVARNSGLILRLLYVATDAPSINVERVAERVAAGGHNVPEDRIRARWHRSLSNLPWFAARADRLVVFDTSGTTIRPLALRHLGGPLEILEPSHPAAATLAPLANASPLPAP